MPPISPEGERVSSDCRSPDTSPDRLNRHLIDLGATQFVEDSADEESRGAADLERVRHSS